MSACFKHLLGLPINAGVGAPPFQDLYQASIYDGLKDADGSEGLATGVTGVRVKGVVGVGTVALTVDGTALLPVFDTTTDTVLHWQVPANSKTIDWIMVGVTQIQLGQGKVV